VSLESILIGLAGVITAATPMVFAVIGETITERAGVINLSLNGTIILAAMAGFVVATTSGSLLLGFVVGAVVGALVALVVAFSSITLKQSQVAVGFVLTLMCRDLAYFLGNPFMGMAGPKVPPAAPIPLLADLPILGTLFFNQKSFVYLSYLLILAVSLDLPHAQRVGLAGHRRKTGGSVHPRHRCEQDALPVHRHRRCTGGPGWTYVLAQRQGWLEGEHFRPGWHRLDRAGDRHLWWVEPAAGNHGSLPVWHLAVAGAGSASPPA